MNKKEIAKKASEEVLYETETLDGVLDKYNITFERMGEIMFDRVFSPSAAKTVNLQELRKYIDMIIKIRGGYAPLKKEVDNTYKFKWITEDEKRKPKQIENKEDDIIDIEGL